MIHRACEIGVRKRDSTKWRAAQRFARGGFPIFAKEKARLGIAVCVPPPIQDDSGDVALRIEARSSEHQIHLLTNVLLVFLVRGREHFGATAVALVFGR